MIYDQNYAMALEQLRWDLRAIVVKVVSKNLRLQGQKQKGTLRFAS
jgi:hypothetical protein